MWQASVVNYPFSDGYRSAIFQFLALEQLEQFKPFSILFLGQVCKACETCENKAADQAFFLQLQHSIFSGWLDRLRTTSFDTTLALLNSLPEEFQHIDVLRTAQHVLTKPRTDCPVTGNTWLVLFCLSWWLKSLRSAFELPGHWHWLGLNCLICYMF